MKEVLFLASDSGIWPLNSGRSQHSFGLCEELSKYVKLHVISRINDISKLEEAQQEIGRGYDITFVQTGNGYKELLMHPINNGNALLSGLSLVETNVINAAIEKIEKYSIDVIIIDYLRNAKYFDYLKKKYPEKKFIYNSHNAEFVNMEKEYSVNNQNNLIDKMLAKIRLRNIIEWEKKIISESNKTLSISLDDIKELVNRYSCNKDKFILSKPLIRFRQVKYEKDLEQFNFRLMIVGTMHWYALVNGIVWFVENVFAKLIETQPRYVLYLVGANPCDEILRLGEKYKNNIVITGTVSSVEEYYELCDISIIPMFEGTGTKLKVLEAMCRGIPTISTTLAAKDYEVENAILIADSSQEFYEKIIYLSENIIERKRLLREMQEYLIAYYVINPLIVDELNE